MEAPGGGGRGLTGTHGDPKVPRTRMQIISGSFGGVEKTNQNVLGASGDERCCVTQEAVEAERRCCACAEALPAALRQSGRGQAELLRGDERDKGRASLRDSRGAPPHRLQFGASPPAVAKPAGESRLSGIKLDGVKGAPVCVRLRPGSHGGQRGD